MKNYIFFLGCLLFGTKIFAQVPVMDPIIGSTTVCSAPSLAQTYTASASNSPVTYSWSVVPSASVVIASQGNSVTTISFPDTNLSYTVYCLAINGNGSSTPVSYVVTVYETPTVTFSGATMFCQGSSTSLMASPTVISGTANLTYNWSPPTGLNTTIGQYVIANPSVTTTYSVNTFNGYCMGTNTITINTNPYLAFSGNTSFCQGSSVSLTAGPVSTPASSTVFYQWLPPLGLNTNNGPNVIASPSVSTTYTVLFTDGNCTSTNTINITTNPYATVSGAAMFCQNSTATLTASPATTPTGAVTYSWYPPTGLNTTTGATVVANPPTPTTYSVFLTDGGCTSTSTVVLNTNPSVAVFGPGNFCQGSFAGLTATPLSPPFNANASYNWSPSFGLNTTSGTIVSATPTVSTIYTVTLTDGPCSATATISVHTNPSAVFAGATSFCQGSSANISASPSNTTNTTLTYSWTPSTGLNTTTGPNVVANPLTRTTYTLLLTEGGCTSNNTITIRTNPIPLITGPTVFCQGNQALLHANPAGIPINNFISYNWIPATGLNTTNGANVLASPVVSTTYTVILTDGVCTSTNTFALHTNPTVIASGPGNFCPGSASSLTATPLGSPVTTPVSYVWTPPQGLNTTSGTNVLANPNVTTIYTVSLVDGNCTSIDTVMVFANPTVVFDGTTTICGGGSTTLTASLDNNPGSATSFNWAPSTGLDNTTSASVIASPTTSTAYTVIINGNGCSYTGIVTVFTEDCNITGIKTNTADNGNFILYPNPNNGTFSIRSGKKETATLVNELGQVIQVLNLQAGEETTINSLVQGIYFIITPTAQKKISVLKSN